MIDKCGTFLDVLKTSPSMRTSSKICRELSNELKVIRSNIGSIVDNRSSNNKSLNVGNKNYIKQRLESILSVSPEFLDVIFGRYTYTMEYVKR